MGSGEEGEGGKGRRKDVKKKKLFREAIWGWVFPISQREKRNKRERGGRINAARKKEGEKTRFSFFFFKAPSFMSFLVQPSRGAGGHAHDDTYKWLNFPNHQRRDAKEMLRRHMNLHTQTIPVYRP